MQAAAGAWILRFWASGLVLLFGLSAPAAVDGAPAGTSACDLQARSAVQAGTGCARAWFDANLHLNEIQLVGTAESYKLRPSSAMLGLIRIGSAEDAKELDFAEPPIAEQLELGARSLEFDVAYDPKGGLYSHPAGASMAMELVSDQYVHDMSQPGFKVIHILDIDFNSSCLTLANCLGVVALWSRAHPDHLPIIIALRTNDDRTPMPGATHPQMFDAAAFDALDRAIQKVFRQDEIITPDKVRGNSPSLRQAVEAKGWPSLGASRGKVLFLLDDSKEKVDLYRGARPSLEKRVMFISTDPKSPAAAFMTVEDPAKAAGQISQAVRAGLMVHTYADAGTKEARASNTARRDKAFASGAQIISTDFIRADTGIGKYEVRLAKGHAGQCGVLFVPKRCGGLDVETGRDSGSGER
ncbi:MAG TPA: Ca2+-dependent phosphoinositide-specific phospholipase C [Rhizomicrobium sp.]|nr:Ca2+-dependent phosphoinositide-specific phospholipase C [Rhizomicrobium sp.]